jgi:hypothetical protein
MANERTTDASSHLCATAVSVSAHVWDDDVCTALAWRFRASTIGHTPIKTHGADRIRYDLPIGEEVRGKLRQAFPWLTNVSSVGQVYKTSALTASALDPHTYSPVVLKEAGCATTHTVLVFLTGGGRSGRCTFGDNTSVHPSPGTAEQFQHGVTFASQALAPTDPDLLLMVFRAW